MQTSVFRWSIVLAAALCLAPPALLHAAEQTPQQREASAQLDAVRARIEALTARQQKAASERDDLGKALAEQAQALATAAAALRESDARLEAVQQRLDALEEQRVAVEARLQQQHAALAALLRATYKLGYGSDLRLLLGHVNRCPETATTGAEPSCAPGEAALAQVQRALAYSRYFQVDRARKIRALLDALAQRRRLAEALALQRQAVADERRQRTHERDALAAQRERQQALLATVRADMARRGKQLGGLEQQRKALEELLERLRDVFADIPATLADDKPFAERRGALPWPLEGKVSVQKDGILIHAPSGSRVRAVAHGRVAYADWLRGYGMLLIIDHGDGWMSLYGDNESLLRGVGDWVNAGAVIATSGRAESGAEAVFFGLRHQGQEVRPQRWLKPR